MDIVGNEFVGSDGMVWRVVDDDGQFAFSVNVATGTRHCGLTEFVRLRIADHLYGERPRAEGEYGQ